VSRDLRAILRLALAALAFSGLCLATMPEAAAQAASAPRLVPCMPNNWVTPWGTGSDYHHVSTDKASGRFVWCRQPDGGWNIVVLQFRINGVDAPQGWDVDAALARVMPKVQAAASGGADRISAAASAVAAEFAAASVPLQTSSQRYELWRLKHKACLEMVASPMPVVPPGGLVPPPASWCAGLDPGQPPPPDAVAYAVSGASAYPVGDDGRRSLVPWPQAPAKGQECFCADKEILVVVSGVTVRYCAVRFPGVTQLLVAGCVPKK
jgi:hypothetical protein